MGLPMSYYERFLDSDNEQDERRQSANKRVKLNKDDYVYTEDEDRVVENEAEDTIVVANPATRSHRWDMFLEPYDADDNDVGANDGAVYDDTMVRSHMETVENLLIAPPESFQGFLEREEQMRQVGLIARDDLIAYEEFMASMPLMEEPEGIVPESQAFAMAEMAAIYRAERLIEPPTCQDPPAVQNIWGYIPAPTAEEEDEEEEELREALHAHY